MGLLDAMFGGGTKIELALDTTRAVVGGQIGGRVALHGGKKPMRLTALKVRLLYVSVQSRPDSPLPAIDTRILLDNTIAANGDLAPGSVSQHAFRFSIPQGTLPTAHNVSYKVQVQADIPGVKDPTADADLEVIAGGSEDSASMTMDAITAKYPGLAGKNEDALVDALRDLHNDCYGEAASLLAAEPFLAELVRTGTVRVRRAALEAWANLLDNRARPEHLQTLWAIAQTPGLDEETLNEVIKAAAKFAEEGALPLVQHFAANQTASVRKEMADQLRFNSARKFQGKRELLVALGQDQDPEVRAAAFGALTDYGDDQQILHWMANQTDSDPSPDVQRACIAGLGLAHHHGLGDLTFAVYEKHLANPSEEVRKEIANSLWSQPPTQMRRVWVLAQRLLADPSEEVRRAMAFQFRNMEKFRELAPLIQHAAESDPSEEVRNEALAGMAAVTPLPQLFAYYKDKLGRSPSEGALWGILGGLRDHKDDAQGKQMLQQLAKVPNEGVARAAREALE
jgi:HEAT repeat protein